MLSTSDGVHDFVITTARDADDAVITACAQLRSGGFSGHITKVFARPDEVET
jgi:hypothetical protein